MAVRKVVAYQNLPREVIRAMVDSFNDELEDTEKVIVTVLQGWLRDFASKSATNLISGYKVDVQHPDESITVGGISYKIKIFKVRFLPPGGEGQWNVINTLNTGRKGMPKRDQPYVLENPGVIKGVSLVGGNVYRDIQRNPPVTSPNSANLVGVGATEDKLSTQGPIRPVPARNFYPDLIELCNAALKAKGLNSLSVEIIEE